MLILTAIIAAIVATVIGTWLSQSVFFEAVAKLPPTLQDPLTSRYAVDPYIWTESAFRPLRKRYALGNGLLIIAFALWALIAMPYQTGLGAALAGIAVIGLIFLGYRMLRYGL